MYKLLKLILTILLTINMVKAQSIYDVKINDISGNPINLNDYKGKKMLFVNVASFCGFTSQYKGLEELYKEYEDQLMIFGIPCNQFGNQEPGDAKEIMTFCENNYDISFIITEKVNVKGEEQHELYKWLTNKKYNQKKDSKVKWNFQKYIVNEDGNLLDYFVSTTSPQSSKIIKLIEN